ncbi:hypothetical protein GGI42DRAFT_313964, partial [Trichoderma sp. SZMC 28013]
MMIMIRTLSLHLVLLFQRSLFGLYLTILYRTEAEMPSMSLDTQCLIAVYMYELLFGGVGIYFPEPHLAYLSNPLLACPASSKLEACKRTAFAACGNVPERALLDKEKKKKILLPA